MAVPPALLEQLLMLGESERVEIAHALLASVDDKDDLDDTDRAQFHEALDAADDELRAGKWISGTQLVAALRRGEV